MVDHLEQKDKVEELEVKEVVLNGTVLELVAVELVDIQEMVE